MSSLIGSLQAYCDNANRVLERVNAIATASKAVEAAESRSKALLQGVKKLTGPSPLSCLGREHSLLGAGLAKVTGFNSFDLLGTAVNRIVSESSKWRVAWSLPKIDALLQPSRAFETFGQSLEKIAGSLDLARTLTSRDTYFHHVSTVASEEATEEEKLQSLTALLRTAHRLPVARERWRAHSRRLKVGIQERAESLGTSRRKAWDSAVEGALFKACAELKLPRDRTCLVHDGKRYFVQGLIAWEDLGITKLRGYIRNRLSDEVMDVLVQDWREFDTQEKIETNARVLSLSDLKPEDVEAPRRSDQQMEAHLSALSLMNSENLSADQRLLMHLMAEEGLTATAAGRRMGKGEAWGRVAIARIRGKLKKTS